MDATVTDNPDESRYEIHTDDGRLAGFTVYRLQPGRISLIHTEIDDEFEGQGLGSKLVAGALDDARRRDLGVLPFCPFVNSYIERHPEYAALVPEGDRERFGL
jgi:predicted GNAT family acetyltransferase